MLESRIFHLFEGKERLSFVILGLAGDRIPMTFVSANSLCVACIHDGATFSCF